MRKWFLVFGMVVILPALFIVQSCSSKKIRANLSMTERMQLADEYFAKKRYLDARDQYRILTLSYSGSRLADKAQFYLAECHFYTKEYILSASEYERLIKMYPNSEYVDDAKYKLGYSYFKMSPKYSLDQEYTLKAIREFQEFLEEYRTSDLVPVVEKQLAECRNKLAQKQYSSAEIYYKMKYWDAAIIYFNLVLDQYFDSQYAPKAQFYLAESYRNLRKYEEAAAEYDRFIEKFPKHEWVGKAREQSKNVKVLRSRATPVAEKPAEDR
ncbi:outer membrane protein assembly factor BamD [bacterium]|nr:outer membrane protein assembly factor BamD [bacterium]